jgi:hypothetical protein
MMTENEFGMKKEADALPLYFMTCPGMTTY